MNISIAFDPRDIWIGIFWQYSKSVESDYRVLNIYVTFIPMFPIKFQFERGGWRR